MGKLDVAFYVRSSDKGLVEVTWNIGNSLPTLTALRGIFFGATDPLWGEYTCHQ